LIARGWCTCGALSVPGIVNVRWQYSQLHFDKPSIRVSQLGERCAGQVDAAIQSLGWAAIIASHDYASISKLDAYPRAEWDIPHGARHVARLKHFAGRGEIPSTLVAVPTSGNGDSWRGSGIGARHDVCEYARAGYDGEYYCFHSFVPFVTSR